MFADDEESTCCERCGKKLLLGQLQDHLYTEHDSEEELSVTRVRLLSIPG